MQKEMDGELLVSVEDLPLLGTQTRRGQMIFHRLVVERLTSTRVGFPLSMRSLAISTARISAE